MEVLIQDDVRPDGIELCGFDSSIQVSNLGSPVDTRISMGHQGLEDKMLPKMHQCVLAEVPLALLTMVSNPQEHFLGLASHVINVVRPKIVAVQKLISKPTIAGLLHGLNDREGIMGEKNLRELLPHRRPVDKETRGKRAKSLGVRATTAPAKRMGPHTIISSS